MARGWLLLAGLPAWLCLLAPASARPPQKAVLLEPGPGRFEPGATGGWRALSLDPAVVEAQAFETDEVFLTPRGEGVGRLLLYHPEVRGLLVWQVRVGGPAEPRRPAPGPLAGPCGCGAEGTYPLHCQVRSAECLEALRALLADADLSVEDVRLELAGVPAMQALLRDLGQRLEKAGIQGVKLAFSGANLKVEGEVADRAAWGRLVGALYDGMVGALVLDDRVLIRSEAGQEGP
ncbi:MAG TPA: hypothetical protein PK668_21780 [Myxococcota bacterium]|nr:hypothetical protein [Myxococcota bacterium]HRY96395.1 hypothetical protein [Myxococcota bacterium]HSA20839.1 hypothetical protein [Myxococcota bacterium]